MEPCEPSSSILLDQYQFIKAQIIGEFSLKRCPPFFKKQSSTAPISINVLYCPSSGVPMDRQGIKPCSIQKRCERKTFRYPFSNPDHFDILALVRPKPPFNRLPLPGTASLVCGRDDCLTCIGDPTVCGRETGWEPGKPPPGNCIGWSATIMERLLLLLGFGGELPVVVHRVEAEPGDFE